MTTSSSSDIHVLCGGKFPCISPIEIQTSVDEATLRNVTSYINVRTGFVVVKLRLLCTDVTTTAYISYATADTTSVI